MKTETIRDLYTQVSRILNSIEYLEASNESDEKLIKEAEALGFNTDTIKLRVELNKKTIDRQFNSLEICTQKILSLLN